MKISCVIVLVVFHLCHAQNIKKCLTPSGREGTCKSIYDCLFLKSLATKELISRKEVNYLRRSACGFHNSIPLVCCSEYGADTCAPSADPPDPWSGCCGITATRFFRRGTYVPAIDQYPWMAIMEHDKDNKTRLLGTGTLISSRYVVTVASNFKLAVGRFGAPKRVRLGEFDTSHPGPDCVEGQSERHCTDGAFTVPIEHALVHPGYNYRRKKNDIALVRLSKTAPYTDFIRPICLPTMDFTQSPPRYFKLLVAGWGATKDSRSSDFLRHVGLPYVDLKTCQTAFTRLHNLTLSEQHVCAGGEPGRDSCRGDSGAPLMYDAGPFVEVVGLVSFGTTPCGMAGIPSVYTKIFAYDKWIRENIKP